MKDVEGSFSGIVEMDEAYIDGKLRKEANNKDKDVVSKKVQKAEPQRKIVLLV